MNWLRISVLGNPQFLLGDVPVVFKTRKCMALLVYLILEKGFHTREHLMDLLWPDKDQDQARASLRQTLARVRDKLDDAYLITSRDQLGFNFAANHQLDIDGFTTGLTASTSIEDLENALVLYRGEFLQHFELEDAPEFGDWLKNQRELFRHRLELILDQLLQQYSHAGRTSDALETGLRWVKLDAFHETPRLHLIELNLKQSNHSAALKVFLEYRALCKHEGLELSESLQAIGQKLTQRPAVNPDLLHIPALIGREREWAMLEQAWRKCQNIFVSGEAGMGKTRLVREFVGSKGIFVESQGRLGDALVPYAVSIRLMGALFAQCPLEVQPWVQRELARFLPDLGEASSEPLDSTEARTRFFQAYAEAAREACRFIDGVINDDIQWWDSSSTVLGVYVNAQVVTENSGMVPSIGLFRRNEMPPDILEMVQQSVDDGVAVLIELSVLNGSDVTRILESSGISIPEKLGEEIARYCAGNPMFILETARNLVSTRRLDSAIETQQLPNDFPPANQIISLLQKRLEHPSAQARALLELATVMKEDFTSELAGRLLGRNASEMDQSLQELEVEQVFEANRFSHDLLQDAARNTVSTGVWRVLNRLVLELLEQNDASPFRLLRYAIQTEQPELISRHGFEATRQAANLFAHEEITDFVRQGVIILQRQDRTKDAAQLLVELSRSLAQMGRMQQSQDMLLEASEHYRQLGETQMVAELGLEFHHADQHST
jgi:DNA-binding SARP family transcriptional activator